MAKSKEKNQALEFRRRGDSIREIAKRLKVAKSTVSLWCSDIELTPQQTQRLHDQMVRLSYKGRMKGARMQYEKRLARIDYANKKGLKQINKLSDRDWLVIGLSLYWGEGSKKNRRVSISNSDPRIIKFMMNWFKEVWGIKSDRFTLYVSINKIHRDRIKDIEKYWSKITNIPITQFNKTVLIKAKSKKNYKNFPVYYGTLTINVKKSAEIYYRIMGLINAMSELAAGE